MNKMNGKPNEESEKEAKAQVDKLDEQANKL